MAWGVIATTDHPDKTVSMRWKNRSVTRRRFASFLHFSGMMARNGRRARGFPVSVAPIKLLQRYGL